MYVCMHLYRYLPMIFRMEIRHSLDHTYTCKYIHTSAHRHTHTHTHHTFWTSLFFASARGSFFFFEHLYHHLNTHTHTHTHTRISPSAQVSSSLQHVDPALPQSTPQKQPLPPQRALFPPILHLNFWPHFLQYLWRLPFLCRVRTQMCRVRAERTVFWTCRRREWEREAGLGSCAVAVCVYVCVCVCVDVSGVCWDDCVLDLSSPRMRARGWSRKLCRCCMYVCMCMCVSERMCCAVFFWRARVCMRVCVCAERTVFWTCVVSPGMRARGWSRKLCRCCMCVCERERESEGGMYDMYMHTRDTFPKHTLSWNYVCSNYELIFYAHACTLAMCID